MNAKCPCEKCNRIIRQSYATYVMGGTKTTPSGNQVVKREVKLFIKKLLNIYATFLVFDMR